MRIAKWLSLSCNSRFGRSLTIGGIATLCFSAAPTSLPLHAQTSAVLNETVKSSSRQLSSANRDNVHHETNSFPVSGTILYSFGISATDAIGPTSNLTQASDGNLYGVSNGGGASSAGAIYQITTSGQETVVYSFTGKTDGANPQAALVEAADGNLYGTTSSGGGASGGGTIFQYSVSSGAFATVYTFTDFAYPLADLIDDGNGNLYGTDAYGGADGSGIVFSYNYTTSVFTTLYTFTGNEDGASPYGALVLASDGNLYGTTSTGGGFLGQGTAFVIGTTGSNFTAFYKFTTSSSGPGGSPFAGLVEYSDGNLYGAASVPGAFFQIVPSGAASTVNLVFSFGTQDSGVNVGQGRPFIGGDGNFYISASSGGVDQNGQVMQLTSSGGFADVNDFSNFSFGSGAAPRMPLESTDGNLYVATGAGGTNGDGTLDQLPTGLPPVISLTASQTTVSAGSPLTLTWAVNNAYGKNAQVCIARSSDGSWAGAVGISGSASVTPLALSGTVTYAYTCGGVETALAAISVAGVKNPTTTAVTATPNPVVIGQSVVLSATVIGGSAPATGTVTFYYGSTVLGSGTVNSQVASYSASTAGIPPGTYGVTAQYFGDSTYSGSTSAPVPITVVAAPTSTALTASSAAVTAPSTVTLTATVTGSSGTIPAGRVTFFNSANALVTVPLTNGTAAYVAPTEGFPAGTYQITALYSGGSGDAASTSSVVSVTITPIETFTLLSASSSSVTRPNPVSLTATVFVQQGDVPTGSVTFYYMNDILGTVRLNSSGEATLTIPTQGIPPGSYAITAKYNGGGSDTTSTSSPVTVTVQ
jgi:uncharacterized repeat protein (TIGR03803 family)